MADLCAGAEYTRDGPDIDERTGLTGPRIRIETCQAVINPRVAALAQVGDRAELQSRGIEESIIEAIVRRTELDRLAWSANADRRASERPVSLRSQILRTVARRRAERDDPGAGSSSTRFAADHGGRLACGGWNHQQRSRDPGKLPSWDPHRREPRKCRPCRGTHVEPFLPHSRRV